MYVKTIMLMTALCILFSQSIPALAEESRVTLYNADGRIAAVDPVDASVWENAGWTRSFPYAGKSFWCATKYLETNIKDTNDLCTFAAAENVNYTKITIDWYDGNDWSVVNEEEKQLKTLLFTYKDREYKISLGDLLRSKPVFGSFQNPIFWSNPQQIYSMTDDEWYQIQHYKVWLGMTKEKFLLTQVYTPDRIITRYFSYGRRDQYTYVLGLIRTDYYLKNDLLDSWKITEKKS